MRRRERHDAAVTRRHFVQQALGSAAAAVALRQIPEAWAQTPLPTATQTLGAGAPDQEFWTRVRAKFMLPAGEAYLNNGTLGPVPRPVSDTLVEQYRLLASDPALENMRQYRLVDEIRRNAASFVGAAPDEIALTPNTTEGMGLAAGGLDLRAGDQVLLTFHEHPSGLEPWRMKAKRSGVVLRELPFSIPMHDPAELLNAFNDAITPRTKVVSVSHVTFQTGTVMPVGSW